MLEARNICKRFGGLEALTDVSLAIQPGEIYGLIGPNGAGKTTFFNVLTGFYPADSGEFIFDGARLNVDAPHQVAAAGIARTFQNIRLFGNMTALENVMVGTPCAHACRRDRRGAAHRAAPAPRSARFTNAPTRCSITSASPRARTTSRTACLTATSAGSKSRARSRPSPSCSRSTNPPPA